MQGDGKYGGKNYPKGPPTEMQKSPTGRKGDAEKRDDGGRDAAEVIDHLAEPHAAGAMLEPTFRTSRLRYL